MSLSLLTCVDYGYELVFCILSCFSADTFWCCKYCIDLCFWMALWLS